jgi:Protein of unknown function (DUF1573)
MKKIFFLVAVIFGVHTFVNAQNSAKFKFVNEMHDFGALKEGEDATYDFVFTNTGNEPLIITNCSAQCGCTTPVWERAPVLPGKSAKITVKYDTKGKNGAFIKSVYIQSNAQLQAVGKDRYEIQIKGSVIPK